MTRGKSAALTVFLVLGGFLGAQVPSVEPTLDPIETQKAEVSVPGESPVVDGAAVPEVRDLVKETMAQDISSCDYYQLVDWTNSLGLETTGGVEDLKKRLYAHFDLSPPAAAEKASQSISIDSADGSEYFTLEKIDEDYIQLTGNVVLVLRDLEKKVEHRIQADSITFNQSRSMLTAKGRVNYKMIKEGSGEDFSGESLSFNLDDWKGIFYQGVSSRQRSVGGTSLDFSFGGDRIKRSSQDMVLLENGIITSSLRQSPYWRIQARKIWIMAPGEWGLQDAVLHLGRIPIFYFPFFFQPGDEMFFNPVLGLPTVPDRRGSYLQTTTYLLGSKKKDASALSFLQVDESGGDTSDKTEIRGLYLVRPQVKKNQDPLWSGQKDSWAKVLLDFYSNLGMYSALEGSISALGPLTRTTFLASLATSFNVYQASSADRVFYTPFSSGTFDPGSPFWEQYTYNDSWFLGTPVPFRTGVELGLESDFAKLSWEYYTDPFLSSDFRDRSENFSMFSLIGFGPKSTTVSEKSGLLWRGDLKINPSFPQLSPWIQSVSFTQLYSSLEWSRKENASRPSPDPARAWFAPSRLTALALGLNLSGSPFQTQTSPGPAAGTGQAPDWLVPPWGEQKSQVQPQVPPQVEGPLPAPTPWPNRTLIQGSTSTGSLAIQYSWTPRGSWQTFYDQSPWLTPEDMDWSSKYTQLSLNQDAKASVKLGLGNYGSMDESISLVHSLRNSRDFAQSLSVSETDSLLIGDAQGSLTKINQSASFSFTPFYDFELLRSTRIQYSLASRLWETRYLSWDSAQSRANYTVLGADWDATAVTAHEISGTSSFSPFADPEVIKLTGSIRSTLDPRVIERTGTLALSSSLGFIRSNASSGIKYSQLTDWTLEPLRVSLDLGTDKEKLTSSLEYSLEEKWPVQFQIQFNAWGLTARTSFARLAPYRFDDVALRWVQDPQQDFYPRDASLSYTYSSPALKAWKDRISLGGNLSTSWNMDLQRFTESSLSFTLGLNLKIHQALEFSFASVSTNRAMFRYFPFLVNALGLDLPVLNPVSDLASSFYFWDEEARRESNFKISSLSMTVTHTMPDWNLSFKYSGLPQRNEILKTYEWKPSFSFSVLWKPIPEIRNETSVDVQGNYTVKTNS